METNYTKILAFKDKDLKIEGSAGEAGRFGHRTLLDKTRHHQEEDQDGVMAVADHLFSRTHLRHDFSVIRRPQQRYLPAPDSPSVTGVVNS